MDICKVGVIGVGRGTTMMDYCKNAKNAKLVAICDKWEEGLERQKAKLNDPNITRLFTDAGVVLVIIPVVLIYLLLQRQFIEGVERSGIVG